MLGLVVNVAAADVELASDHLWSLGVVAIEERPAAGDGIDLWTSLGDDAPTVIAALRDLPYTWRFEEVDAEVADTWRLFAQPTWVAADFVIHPAWQPAPPLAAGAISLAIEPGATFGMGDHPTTITTLRAMREVLRPGDQVLDVGCGSGVLAVAACLCGARRVTAIDISAAAVPTTIANAAANGVADRVVVSTTPLAAVTGTFDVVLANILAPALVEMSTDLRRVVAPNGALVISGILATAHAHVLDALHPLHVVAREDLDGWTAITLRWPAAARADTAPICS